MKSRLFPSFLRAGLIVVLAACARAEDAPATIKFSDPAKPGTLKINLGRGELRIQGADTNEVSVKTEAKAVSAKPRKDGLRVISAASSFSFKESDNVVSLDAAANEWGRGNSDFRITVPRNTAVIIQNSWGGDINCTGISGDIEINCMHGEVKLDDVSGGVVVSTMNGEIRANFRELHEGKPLSFTTMNGEVVLRVPETAKANVRLRTQNGSVLTDFDETALITKTETTAGMPRGRTITSKGNKVITVEVQEAIREAAQIGATAVREALEAVKEGLEAAKLNSEEAKQQLEKARREMESSRSDADRARRDSENARRDAERERDRVANSRTAREATPKPPALPATPKPVVAPMPPKIPVPTITGGKLVTGTLNGGGPEISVSTMNGDVTLRKLEPKK